MKNHTEPRTITVHVPMTFTIHGGRKMIISDADGDGGFRQHKPSHNVPKQRTENALLKAIAKAHRWRQKIENGDHESITELAKAENINQSYACRILRLTLLAPSIITEILNGQYSSDLMLKRVMKPLPALWGEQLLALKVPATSRQEVKISNEAQKLFVAPHDLPQSSLIRK